MSAVPRESDPRPATESPQAASPIEAVNAYKVDAHSNANGRKKLETNGTKVGSSESDALATGNGHLGEDSEHSVPADSHTAHSISNIPVAEAIASQPAAVKSVPVPVDPTAKQHFSIERGISTDNSSVEAAPKSAPTSVNATDYAGSTYRDGDYRWNKGTYSRPQRFIDIWSFVLKLLSKRWLYGKAWSYAGEITPEKQTKRRQDMAVWIRETCLSLGPTFIKIGQLFSTRADLFPIEYVEELSKLQDRVPAFSYEKVKSTIEDDFGRPLAELYKSFEPVPIAAASLGQVHCAQLHSGEEVVVKIQRPGLSRLFAIDLSILKGIAQYFQNHKEWGRGRDWMGIYAECCRLLWLEIDFLHEGRNGDKFRRNFRGVDWVKVPRIYWRYTSPRVLTMEYMPGIKISHYEALESAGLDRKRLARLGAEAYLRQLLTDGFFHADPHPGNIAVDTDGALIFYDFGMMGQIPAVTRSRLMDTFVGIAQRNAGLVMDSLVELGALARLMIWVRCGARFSTS